MDFDFNENFDYENDEFPQEKDKFDFSQIPDMNIKNKINEIKCSNISKSL